MKTTHILHTSIFTLLLGASGVLAAPPTETPTAANAPAKTQPNELTILEEDYYVIQNEPHIHLVAVAKAEAKKDWKTAGAELRKAGFFLRAEASGATETAPLQNSAHELTTVGKDLENGVARTEAEIQHAITDAYAALAHHHYLRATEKRAALDWNGAKHELAAATDAVEGKLKSGGESIDGRTETLLNDCRKAAAATEAKADQAEAAVGGCIDAGRKWSTSA